MVVFFTHVAQSLREQLTVQNSLFGTHLQQQSHITGDGPGVYAAARRRSQALKARWVDAAVQFLSNCQKL